MQENSMWYIHLKCKKKRRKLNFKEKDSRKIELPIFKYGLIFHVLYLLAYITIFYLKNDPIMFIFGFCSDPFCSV